MRCVPALEPPGPGSSDVVTAIVEPTRLRLTGFVLEEFDTFLIDFRGTEQRQADEKGDHAIARFHSVFSSNGEEKSTRALEMEIGDFELADHHFTGIVVGVTLPPLLFPAPQVTVWPSVNSFGLGAR